MKTFQSGQKFCLLPRQYKMSRVMRKPFFCICENIDADQLRSYRKADQRLCFCYTDSTIPLLPESKISNLYPSSVAVQPGLYWTWSENPRRPVFSRRGSYTSFYIQNNMHQSSFCSVEEIRCVFDDIW